MIAVACIGGGHFPQLRQRATIHPALTCCDPTMTPSSRRTGRLASSAATRLRHFFRFIGQWPVSSHPPQRATQYAFPALMNSTRVRSSSGSTRSGTTFSPNSLSMISSRRNTPRSQRFQRFAIHTTVVNTPSRGATSGYQRVTGVKPCDPLWVLNIDHEHGAMTLPGRAVRPAGDDAPLMTRRADHITGGSVVA